MLQPSLESNPGNSGRITPEQAARLNGIRTVGRARRCDRPAALLEHGGAPARAGVERSRARARPGPCTDGTVVGRLRHRAAARHVATRRRLVLVCPPGPRSRPRHQARRPALRGRGEAGRRTLSHPVAADGSGGPRARAQRHHLPRYPAVRVRGLRGGRATRRPSGARGTVRMTSLSLWPSLGPCRHLDDRAGEAALLVPDVGFGVGVPATDRQPDDVADRM